MFLPVVVPINYFQNDICCSILILGEVKGMTPYKYTAVRLKVINKVTPLLIYLGKSHQWHCSSDPEADDNLW